MTFLRTGRCSANQAAQCVEVQHWNCATEEQTSEMLVRDDCLLDHVGTCNSSSLCTSVRIAEGSWQNVNETEVCLAIQTAYDDNL